MGQTNKNIICLTNLVVIINIEIQLIINLSDRFKIFWFLLFAILSKPKCIT